MTSPVPSSTSDTKSRTRTALTVALVLAGLFALDRTAGAVLGWAYNHSSASPLVALHASQADTVVIGTSTARYAFVPSAWPTKMVNFAQDGQTVLFSIALARVLSAESAVKRIIIGIDPYDLNSGVANPSAARIWRIAPTIGSYPDLAPLLTETKPATASLMNLSAAWTYRGTLPQIARGLGKTQVPGYTPLAAGHLIEPRNTTRTAPERPFSPSLDRYVAVLANVARRPGLQVVLVVTPAYKDNRAAHPDQARLLDELHTRLGDAPVCDLTQADTPVIDALRTNPANFHDNIHLTEAGGKIYTADVQKMIAERCK